jgi:hypothetical protein
MSVTVRAPQRIAPRRAPARRPELRVVGPEAAPQRLRVATVGALATVTVFGLLFALAMFQIALVQGQQHLDELDTKVQASQQRYEALRLQVAQLESPEHIVDEAINRLGMVPPPGTTYLTPDGAVTADTAAAGTADPEAASADATDPESATATADEAAADGWATVKPYLGTAP